MCNLMFDIIEFSNTRQRKRTQVQDTQTGSQIYYKQFILPIATPDNGLTSKKADTTEQGETGVNPKSRLGFKVNSCDVLCDTKALKLVLSSFK